MVLGGECDGALSATHLRSLVTSAAYLRRGIPDKDSFVTASGLIFVDYSAVCVLGIYAFNVRRLPRHHGSNHGQHVGRICVGAYILFYAKLDPLKRT